LMKEKILYRNLQRIQNALIIDVDTESNVK